MIHFQVEKRTTDKKVKPFAELKKLDQKMVLKRVFQQLVNGETEHFSELHPLFAEIQHQTQGIWETSIPLNIKGEGEDVTNWRIDYQTGRAGLDLEKLTQLLQLSNATDALNRLDNRLKAARRVGASDLFQLMFQPSKFLFFQRKARYFGWPETRAPHKQNFQEMLDVLMEEKYIDAAEYKKLEFIFQFSSVSARVEIVVVMQEFLEDFDRELENAVPELIAFFKENISQIQQYEKEQQLIVKLYKAMLQKGTLIENEEKEMELYVWEKEQLKKMKKIKIPTVQ